MPHTYHTDLKLEGKGLDGLHCTLLQWYETDHDLDTIFAAFDPVFSRTRAIPLLALGKEKFGPHRDVDVNLVHPSTDLIRLHFAACDVLDTLKVKLLVPEWFREGYRPHFAVKDGQRFAEGREVIVRRIRLHEISRGRRATKYIWNLPADQAVS